MLTLVVGLLEELLRGEILRLLDSGKWTERTLSAALDKSQGALQGWTRKVRPSKPGLDVLEGVARIKGISTEQLVAELYGRAYAPTGDRTWPEIGADMSNREFEELLSGMDVESLEERLVLFAGMMVQKAKDFESTGEE